MCALAVSDYSTEIPVLSAPAGGRQHCNPLLLPVVRYEACFAFWRLPDRTHGSFLPPYRKRASVLPAASPHAVSPTFPSSSSWPRFARHRGWIVSFPWKRFWCFALVWRAGWRVGAAGIASDRGHFASAGPPAGLCFRSERDLAVVAQPVGRGAGFTTAEPALAQLFNDGFEDLSRPLPYEPGGEGSRAATRCSTATAR